MRAQGDVFVFTGPIFDPDYETIGRNKIWVPTRLFKLVYDQATGRAWAHVLPNASDARISKPMDYAGFVRETGLDLE
jgi:endonuclease G